MKVSLNWIRFLNQKYHCAAEPASEGINDLVEKIGLQLGAVEEVVDLGKKYRGVLIVKVVSCVKHPNADKLSLCLVDDGRKQKAVKRDKNGLVEVVCGAPNVKAGMMAAWIPPGSTVPSTFDKEPFVIEAREIRGVTSNGMLASAKELDLGDDHSGIIEVDEGKPGDDFAKTYGLDDYIIDIENKMFTHRPDCFGILGVAREIAGIQGNKFKSPDWYREETSINKSRARDDRKISFKNSVTKLVPRFSTAVIKDIKVKQSPVWLKTSLSSVGIRPINNIVDLTNFFMHETAQPLHAYDYDKVLALQKNKNEVKMGVRLSKKGEELNLLGDKKLKLDEGALVITAEDRPIGLGGVMGGADTEVGEDTRNIILECANFDMNLTRKTAMRYGLFTDAATRFTKGQSPRQNMAVLAKATDDIERIAGGRVSAVIDDKNFKKAPNPVKISAEFIEERLGEKLGAAKIKQLLENVEFEVKVAGQNIAVTAPFWRTDIEIPEDIVEEVGRLYGYEHLPQILPTKNLSPAKVDPRLAAKTKIREVLSAAGANEVLTYSFVHGSLLQKTCQDPKFAYKIANALSPDLQYYRISVMPSLLEKIHPNIKAGYDIFTLFEIGKVHSKERPADKGGLPMEDEYTTLVVAASDKAKPAGSAYYQAAKYLDYLVGQPLEFKPISKEMQSFQVMHPYQAGRSAMVHLKPSGEFLGIIGEFKPAVAANLKLPQFCAGFELDTAVLTKILSQPPAYQPLNKFPPLTQDLSLRLPSGVAYAQATDLIYTSLESASREKGYIGSVSPLDIYQKKDDKTYKQIAWRIILSHPERTLTTAEANKLLDDLSAKAKESLKAQRL